MTRHHQLMGALFSLVVASNLALTSGASAAGEAEIPNAEIKALRAELEAMKRNQAALEAKLKDLETTQKQVQTAQQIRPQSSAPPQIRGGTRILSNAANPSIGAVLNGSYRRISDDDIEFAGFPAERHGERGFSLEHTELSFSGSVDDKFFGDMTIALEEHDGESEVELENAYAQTLPGIGLPDGLGIKFGRAFWAVGYLNERHSHSDDFSDRPLPYVVFLDGAYNDDGIEVSYVLPTDIYAEIGAGAFRGNDAPFGEPEGHDIAAWSLFTRLGGDISATQSWRLGLTRLAGKVGDRVSGHENNVHFRGDMDLYVADVRYVWAPSGNIREQEVILQGEYFYRNENGTYEDTEESTGEVRFKDSASGWYAQAVWKFRPQWRIGARYSRLRPADVPMGLAASHALNAEGHKPSAYALMGDWTNSEFGRIRLQYNHEDYAHGKQNDEFILQYIMTLGAHGAHAF